MAKRGDTIKPWLSGRVDCREKRFIQVGNTLMLSETFQCLSPGSKYLYFCMALESAGRSYFTFPLGAAKKYGIRGSSLRRHINELEQKGFIVRHSMKNLRQPNDYNFSYGWKDVDSRR